MHGLSISSSQRPARAAAGAFMGVADAALTGFSGSLLTMYVRTLTLRTPGRVWPTPDGNPVSTVETTTHEAGSFRATSVLH